MRLKRPLATDVGEREGGRSDVSLGDSWWCLIFCPGRRGKEKYDFFFRYYAGLLGGIPSVFFYFFLASLFRISQRVERLMNASKLFLLL